MYYTLITGASSGIGKELAIIAARENRSLLLVARNQKKLDALKEQILESRHSRHVYSESVEPDRESSQKNRAKSIQNTLDPLVKPEGDNPKVEILAIDLSKTTSAKKLYEFCEKKKIFIDELINNAGFGDYGNFLNSDVRRQLQMIDLNIRTLTELTHLFLPNMLKKKSGKIMNLGSVASFLPGPLMSVYFASKSYVLRFSEALAEELNGSGVSVTCLCPGATKTEFGENAQVSETHSTANPKTTAREVAEFGWYHMQNGTRIAIHGRVNRLMLQVSKFIPRNLLARLVKRIQK